MEYCGAGSVSDIIRLRNKTVSILKLFCQSHFLKIHILEADCIVFCYKENISVKKKRLHSVKGSSMRCEEWSQIFVWQIQESYDCLKSILLG